MDICQHITTWPTSCLTLPNTLRVSYFFWSNPSYLGPAYMKDASVLILLWYDLYYSTTSPTLLYFLLQQYDKLSQFQFLFHSLITRFLQQFLAQSEI